MESAEFLNEHAQEEGTGLANETVSEFLANIDKLNANKDVLNRISKEFNIDTIYKLIKFSKELIKDDSCYIVREGKNWSCVKDNIRIVVNTVTYTIVAMHFIK